MHRLERTVVVDVTTVVAVIFTGKPSAKVVVVVALVMVCFLAISTPWSKTRACNAQFGCPVRQDSRSSA